MSSGMLHSLVTRKYLFISVKFPIAPHSHPNRKVCDLQKYRLGIWGSRLSSFSLGPHPQVSRPGRVRQKLSRFSEESPDAAGSYAVSSPGQSPGFPTSMRSGSSTQISRVPAQINNKAAVLTAAQGC